MSNCEDKPSTRSVVETAVELSKESKSIPWVDLLGGRRCTFDPAERAAEKQRLRDEDARRLSAGEVSPRQLRIENSFLSVPFKIVHSGGSSLKKNRRSKP